METRFNGKCKGCKKKHTALLAKVDNVKGPKGWLYAWKSSTGADVLGTGARNWLPVVACECGKKLYLEQVTGKHNAEIACNGKCMGASGHVCECACGGKNHGANGHAH